MVLRGLYGGRDEKVSKIYRLPKKKFRLQWEIFQ